MSAFRREVVEATRLLCAAGGAMQLHELHRKLLQSCRLGERDFSHIMEGCSRFLLVRGPAADGGQRPEDVTVVAQTSLRLCRSYGRDEPCAGDGVCEQLHLCKFFIYGTCRFGKGRKPCRFSHNVQSDHNQRLLRDCTLTELRDDELLLLLLQNHPGLLPEVCLHYNKGSGPHGCCTFASACTKVHLCQHFVQGDCLFGLKCKRQHAIDIHGRRLLEERGLSGDIIHHLPFIYRNIHHLATAATAAAATAATAATATVSATENGAPDDAETGDICLHFIRNSCRFHNECRRVHFYLPYKWEVLDGSSWVDMHHMEDIERDFCDPSKTQSSGDWPVNFLTMTQRSRCVRRLSTVSSVTKPPHYTLTTRWRWYYKGDQGTWVEYGELDDKNRTTSVSSRTLEEAYLSTRTPEVKVVKGQREYVVSFKDMYQRNLKHNTKRKVRRRPHFVSVAEVTKQTL